MNDNEYDETAEIVADAVAKERAAVVAWLRANRQARPRPETCWEADAIERGEHRREEGA